MPQKIAIFIQIFPKRRASWEPAGKAVCLLDITHKIIFTMEKKFSIGDTVQLRSGGPVMTVSGYAKHPITEDFTGKVECSWFINGERRIDIFHQDALEKAS